MNEHDIHDLRKARSLAGWSYLGILIPLLGWILGAISLSTSKYLEPKTIKAENRVQSVRHLAWGAIVVSTIVFAIYVGLGILTMHTAKQEAARVQEEQAKQQQAQNNAEAQAKTAEFMRQTNLSNCLNGVDDWYSTNVKRVTTVFQEQNLLTQKQQEIDKCNLLYGN